MLSDFRYSVNLLKVYSPPTLLRTRFTCLPDLISLTAIHSLNVSRASDLYFNMFSTRYLGMSSMRSSIYRPPAMAVWNGLHISECTSGSGSVAWEVVFGVKGFRATFHRMQLSQTHFPIILGAESMTFGKISKALRPTCAKRWCHYICLSALCQNACPATLSASRQLFLSISIYLVDAGTGFQTPFSTSTPLTWCGVAIILSLRL